MIKELLLPEIQELIRDRNWTELRDIVDEWPVAEIADLLMEQTPSDQVLFFRVLPRHLSSDVFSYLDPEYQNTLIETLSAEETRHLLANLAPDDRTMLLGELPGQVTQRLINLLSPRISKKYGSYWVIRNAASVD